jgi:hypothetical protein
MRARLAQITAMDVLRVLATIRGSRRGTAGRKVLIRSAGGRFAVGADLDRFR